MAELVVEAGLGHPAERRAAEVEVVLGHRVVVHVCDDHRLRLPGAGFVLGAPNLRDPRQIAKNVRYVRLPYYEIKQESNVQ